MQKSIKKSELGITLVALVVTIVVLLILAGVSLNLVLSDSGIIARAKEAKNKTEQAQINTDQAFYELDNWMNVQLDGIEVTLEDGSKVKLTKENFGEYLGKVVTNYKGTSGTEDVTVGENTYTVSKVYRLYWIDFDNKYGDGTGTIYLKADCSEGNYSLQTTGDSKTSKIINLNPSLYNSKSETGDTIAPPTNSNLNMQAVTWLTDTKVWEGLVTSGASTDVANKINYVVGAPSLEMMMDSFNTHYKLTGNIPDYSARTESSPRTKLFYKYPLDLNNYGYGVGPCANSNLAYSVYTSDYSIQTDTKIDTMYYPGSNKLYWLSSPSASAFDRVVHVTYSNGGRVGSDIYSSNWYSFCPLVSLKSDASLKLAE